MSTTRLFLLLALLLGLSVAAPRVQAGNLISSLAAFDDPGGTLSLADVRGQPFVPVQSTLSTGYTTGAYWLRISFTRPATDGPLVLRLRPFQMDSVTLYQLSGEPEQGWQADQGGFEGAATGEPVLPVSPAFRLLPAPGHDTVYLRLQTKGAMLVMPQVLTLAEAIALEHRLDLVLLAIVAAGLLAAVWSAINFWLVGNPLRLPLIGFQLAFCFWAACTLGNFQSWLPAEASDWYASLVRLSFCLLPAASVQFSAALFRHFAATPVFLRRYRVFMLWFPVQVLGLLTGHTALMLMLNLPVHMLSRWYAVVVAWQLKAPPSPARRIVVSAHVMLAALTTLFASILLGRAHFHLSAETDLALLFAYGLIGQLLCLLVLVAQARGASGAAREALARVPLLERQLADAQERVRSVQERAQRDDLTGVASRRQWLAEVESLLQAPRPPGCSHHLLVIDIDHFAATNHTYGSAACDHLLQQMARLLQETLREPDRLGRVGGEEFAVVLMGVSPMQAWQTAERLRAQVAGAALSMPGGLHLRLTVSIGIAILRPDASDGDTWLRQAYQALAEAKRQGRDRVAVADVTHHGAGASVPLAG